MIPPTAETVANTIDSNDIANGWAVTLAAAAVGVMSRLSTSRAPTSCTAIAVVRPSSSMKTIDRNRIGTPRALAASGSTEAKNNGLQIIPRHTATKIATTTRVLNSVVSTATICPVSKPNLLDDLPLYRLKKSTPIPMPKGSMMPIEALRSAALTPSSPRMRAATRDPTTAPLVTDAPKNRATAAPAKESSDVPWIAKARSRAWIIGPIRPASTPRMIPAMIDPRTSGTNWLKLSKLIIVEKSMSAHFLRLVGPGHAGGSSALRQQGQ